MNLQKVKRQANSRGRACAQRTEKETWNRNICAKSWMAHKTFKTLKHDKVLAQREYWPYKVKFLEIAFSVIWCYICNLSKFVNVKLARSGFFRLRTNALSYCWFVWSVRVSVPAETTAGCEIVRRMLDYVSKTERHWLTYIYSFYIIFTSYANRSMTVASFSILC